MRLPPAYRGGRSIFSSRTVEGVTRLMPPAARCRGMPREPIEPSAGDKRFARRGARGRFEEVEEVGRSLARDQEREASNARGKGEGDRGDRRA